MKKEITALLPLAIEATQKYLMVRKGDESRVQKEYDGYAASLGAALRTSGLIPTLVFYTDVARTDGNARRYKLLWAIAYCIKELEDPGTNQRFLLEEVIKKVYGTNAFQRGLRRHGNQTSLPELGLANPEAIRKWTKLIINASIALKLAMRNFKHTTQEG